MCVERKNTPRVPINARTLKCTKLRSDDIVHSAETHQSKLCTAVPQSIAGFQLQHLHYSPKSSTHRSRAPGQGRPRGRAQAQSHRESLKIARCRYARVPTTHAHETRRFAPYMPRRIGAHATSGLRTKGTDATHYATGKGFVSCSKSQCGARWEGDETSAEKMPCCQKILRYSVTALSSQHPESYCCLERHTPQQH